MDGFDIERFVTGISRIGHNAAIGLGYRGHGPGWVELELPWRAELVGDDARGILASGPIFTLMDMATSMATWLSRDTYGPQATLDMRVDYLRAARSGNTVVGRGECYRLTRTIAFVRGEAHDGDPADPIAHVAGSYMFTPGS